MIANTVVRARIDEKTKAEATSLGNGNEIRVFKRFTFPELIKTSGKLLKLTAISQLVECSWMNSLLDRFLCTDNPTLFQNNRFSLCNGC